MKNAGFLLVFLCALSACKKDDSTLTYRYLFAGHIYAWNDQRDAIDCRLENVDLNFDGIWLGGDLMQRTTERRENLDYLDDVLNISAPSTHWAMGNHDVKEGNREWIETATNRGTTFYSAWERGMLMVVLNTNLFINQNRTPDPSDCEQRKAQFDLITTLLDTVQEASHCIILHHHGLLTDSLTGNTQRMDQTFNFYRPLADWRCDQPSTFAASIYPLAVQAEQRGVEILFVGGDFGPRRKQYEFTTLDGVTFLAAGLNNTLGIPDNPPGYVTNFNPDSVLFFDYLPQERLLTWEFQAVADWTGIPDFDGTDGPPCE